MMKSALVSCCFVVVAACTPATTSVADPKGAPDADRAIEADRPDAGPDVTDARRWHGTDGPPGARRGSRCWTGFATGQRVQLRCRLRRDRDQSGRVHLRRLPQCGVDRM